MVQPHKREDLPLSTIAELFETKLDGQPEPSEEEIQESILANKRIELLSILLSFQEYKVFPQAIITANNGHPLELVSLKSGAIIFTPTGIEVVDNLTWNTYSLRKAHTTGVLLKLVEESQMSPEEIYNSGKDALLKFFQKASEGLKPNPDKH